MRGVWNTVLLNLRVYGCDDGEGYGWYEALRDCGLFGGIVLLKVKY